MLRQLRGSSTLPCERRRSVRAAAGGVARGRASCGTDRCSLEAAAALLSPGLLFQRSVFLLADALEKLLRLALHGAELLHGLPALGTVLACDRSRGIARNLLAQGAGCLAKVRDLRLGHLSLLRSRLAAVAPPRALANPCRGEPRCQAILQRRGTSMPRTQGWTPHWSSTALGRTLDAGAATCLELLL